MYTHKKRHYRSQSELGTANKPRKEGGTCQKTSENRQRLLKINYFLMCKLRNKINYIMSN